MTDKVFRILKKDKRIWDEDTQVLNRNLLLRLIEDTDEKIINSLFNVEETKEMFFLKLEKSYIFKVKDFKLFIENNKIFNSYTSYTNRIGLSTGENHFIDVDKLVLNFPFKDCILEGGQRKEDVEDYYYEYEESLTQTQINLGYKEGKYNKKSTEKSEIFYNEILAKNEIDRLLDKKALKNWKRYTKGGEENVSFIKRNKNKTIEENIIIKGNNLIVLKNIKSQFENKVKLVYMDPPYYFENHMKEDTFEYNSNFKLSTWLVFMKNRIEASLDLLRDDGFLVIQMNDYGVFHLKVMLDEIFKSQGGGGFLNHITVKMSDLSGPKMAHIEKKIPKIKEHLLIYSKSSNPLINAIREPSTWDESIDSKRYTNFVDKKNSENPKDWEYTTVRRMLKSLDMEYGTKEGYDYLMDNADCVFRTAVNNSLKKISKENKFDKNIFTPVTTPTGIKKFVYKDEEVIFATSKLMRFNDEMLPSESISDIWLNIALNDLSNEGEGVNLNNGKKPEALLKRIIEITTNKNDIVLDCFMGTATTQAVALKMNRQFIGIEQLDYIKEKSVKRLIKTINGETRGITNEVNWKGGGSFIYCELAEWNEKAKKLILNAKSFEELKGVFIILNDKYFLDYNLNVNNFLNKTINEKEFISLTLEEQKVIFLNMLDLNQLYINKSEMEDAKFELSEENIRLTNEFYKGGD